ncbi:transposase [Okeania sp. SIO2B3]|uniref:transposase n=1 Tax=Okeania sp. SIO2B3 TaxID=2607784 RepID=UPI003419A86A
MTDFLHKLSTKIIRENQTVVLEDLNVSGMVKKRCDPATTPAPLRNAHQETVNYLEQFQI